MGYTATISGHWGKCDDRAILATMAMRSMGIPAAFDFIPIWGSTNTGHSVCSVILPTDSILVFQNWNNDEDNFMQQKTPKVYRRMFAYHQGPLSEQYEDQEELPPLFQDHQLLDVTAMHNVGQRDVVIPINPDVSNKYVYLSVFVPGQWVPIACAENRGSAKFQAVGDGTIASGSTPVKGEHIGSGIVYLPSLYDSRGVHPLAAPIIVSSDSIRVLSPGQEKETVLLTRKYPRLARIARHADQMIGGVFEGANKRDFSDAVELYRIIDRPLSRLQRVAVNSTMAFRYLRFRKTQGIFSLGEIKAYDVIGTMLPGKLIASSVIAEEPELQNVQDGNPLTYFELPGSYDLWAGLEFMHPVHISQIEFCPRNDDNEIYPGDTYELFYWNDAWQSLGVKIATGFTLEYSNVPKGALLWLRDLTKGIEERPFTYENNHQIWW